MMSRGRGRCCCDRYGQCPCACIRGVFVSEDIYGWMTGTGANPPEYMTPTTTGGGRIDADYPYSFNQEDLKACRVRDTNRYAQLWRFRYGPNRIRTLNHAIIDHYPHLWDGWFQTSQGQCGPVHNGIAISGPQLTRRQDYYQAYSTYMQASPYETPNNYLDIGCYDKIAKTIEWPTGTGYEDCSTVVRAPTLDEIDALCWRTDSGGYDPIVVPDARLYDFTTYRVIYGGVYSKPTYGHWGFNNENVTAHETTIRNAALAADYWMSYFSPTVPDCPVLFVPFCSVLQAHHCLPSSPVDPYSSPPAESLYEASADQLDALRDWLDEGGKHLVLVTYSDGTPFGFICRSETDGHCYYEPYYMPLDWNTGTGTDVMGCPMGTGTGTGSDELFGVMDFSYFHEWTAAARVNAFLDALGGPATRAGDNLIPFWGMDEYTRTWNIDVADHLLTEGLSSPLDQGTASPEWLVPYWEPAGDVLISFMLECQVHGGCHVLNPFGPDPVPIPFYCVEDWPGNPTSKIIFASFPILETGNDGTTVFNRKAIQNIFTKRGQF